MAKTFEITDKKGTHKYGIELISGQSIWFDTRDDRDNYILFVLQ